MDLVISARVRTLTTALLSLLFLVFSVHTVSAQETETRIKEGQEFKMKYNEALEFAKSKDYENAYSAFSEARTLAEAAGEANIVQRSSKVLAQIDNMRGTRAFKQENFDGALAHHDTGIANYNAYVPNHYNKAKALQKLDRWEEALAIFQAVMAMDDRKSSNSAEKTVRGHYVFIASSALSSNNSSPSRGDAQRAIDALEEMEGYVEADADVFYYRAEAYKTLGEYAQAVEMADQALAIHRGSLSDKAKIYFVKGESLMFSGSNQDASEAFTNALYGNYKPLAEHYLEELKSSGD